MARKQLARPTDTHEDFLISALWEGVQTSKFGESWSRSTTGICSLTIPAVACAAVYELADSSLSWLAGLHRKSSPMEVDASSSQVSVGRKIVMGIYSRVAESSNAYLCRRLVTSWRRCVRWSSWRQPVAMPKLWRVRLSSRGNRFFRRRRPTRASTFANNPNDQAHPLQTQF